MDAQSVQQDVMDILAHFDSRKESFTKGFVQQVSQPPRRFHMAILVLMVWAFVLLWLSTMAVLVLPDPIAWFSHRSIPVWLTLQIPLVLWVSAFLGRLYGTITLALYLAAGFAGLPIFADGGGGLYFSQATVGYLLGYLLCPFILHSAILKAHQGSGWWLGSFVWLFFATLLGVLCLHGAGVLGLGMLVMMGKLPVAQFLPMLTHYAWPLLLYDIVFGFAALAIVRFTRTLLWFNLS